MQHTDAEFELHRQQLERLAYRMLGSRADADDVLQEAYLRWANVNLTDVEYPRAYLHSIVTRLCIDRRRIIDARKETYVGPWLPEPIVEADDRPIASNLEAIEALSMAMLVVLETLTPTERAGYLLRKIFDYDYAEIARILEQSEANCRQLVSRAEKRIAARRPRFEASTTDAEQITDAFLQSCMTGDLEGLTALLTADAVTYSDGGGKVRAALAPIYGADRVARFFLGITKRWSEGVTIRRVRVNGQPGLMAVKDGAVMHVLSLDIIDGRIANCFIIRNPDKLPRGLQDFSM